MQVDDLLADGQPDPAALEAVRGMQPLEDLEDALLVGFLDADPLVLHSYQPLAIPRLGANAHQLPLLSWT